MRNRTPKTTQPQTTTQLPPGTLLDRLFEEWLPRFWAFLTRVWDHRPEQIDTQFGRPTRIDLLFEVGLKWFFVGMPPERLLDESPKLNTEGGVQERTHVTTQPASPPPPPDDGDVKLHWNNPEPVRRPPPRPGPSARFLREIDQWFQAVRDPKTPPPIPPEAGKPLKPPITSTQFLVVLGAKPDKTPPPLPRMEFSPEELEELEDLNATLAKAEELTPPPRWWTELTWSQVVLTLHIVLWVWATTMLFGVIGRQVALPIVTPLLMVTGGFTCYWLAMATLPTGPLPIVGGAFFTALMGIFHLRYEVDFPNWGWYLFGAYLLTGIGVAIYHYHNRQAWRWDQLWDPYRPLIEWVTYQLIPIMIRIEAFIEDRERQIKWGVRAGLLLLSSMVSTVVFLRCGLEIAWWGYPFLAIGVIFLAGVNAVTGGRPLWIALGLTVVPAMFTTGMNLWCNFAIIFVLSSLSLAWPLWRDYRLAKEMNQTPHWW